MNLLLSIRRFLNIELKYDALEPSNAAAKKVIVFSLGFVLFLLVLFRWNRHQTQFDFTEMSTSSDLEPYYDDVLKKFQTLGFEERCTEYFKGLEKNSSIPTFISKWGITSKTNTDEHDIEPFAKHRGDLRKLITDTRVYSHCFIHNNILQNDGFLFHGGATKVKLKHRLSKEVSISLFPWCSHLMIPFKRITEEGALVEEYVPVIDKSFEQKPDSVASFFHDLERSKNGRGIVIPLFSMDDFYKILNLIRLLRFLDYSLPVQIVHSHALSTNQESELRSALNDKVQTDFISLELLDSSKHDFNYDFPPLKQAWTVDLSVALASGYGDLLDKHSFTAAALLFTSFKDAILIDPSTLPRKRLLEISRRPLLKEFGAYFFDNYKLKTKIEPQELELFRDLMPNDVDKLVFDMETLDLSLMNSTRFFRDSRSYSTSNDVIFLDTKLHTTGLLIAIQLKFSKLEIATEGLRADLNWLSLAASGTTKAIPVHNIPVGVIGEFSQKQNRVALQSRAKEICSVHRAYFESLDRKLSQSLLFVTDGIANCDSKVEITQEMTGVLSNEKYLKARTKFYDVIVPKPQEQDSRSNLGEVSEFITKETGFCGDTGVCAYDVIDGQKEGYYHAFASELTLHDRHMNDVISEVWFGQ